MSEPVLLIDGDGAEELTQPARELLTLVAGLSEAAGRGEPLELSVVLTDDAGIQPLVILTPVAPTTWGGVKRLFRME